MKKKVCLDPGHGGQDSGAIGPSGLLESDAALRLCRYVRRGLLDADYDVVATRDEDRFLMLKDRVWVATSTHADLLLSVHCNAFWNPQAHGAECWTSVGQTAADPIAEDILALIGKTFPDLYLRTDKTDGDSDKEAGFAVLRGAEANGIPAVLVETAFISNPIEERWFHDVGWNMRMAGAIVSGVNRSL